jgi:hypothetical protein
MGWEAFGDAGSDSEHDFMLQSSTVFLGADGERQSVHDLYGAFRRPGTEADRAAAGSARDLLEIGDLPEDLPEEARKALALGDVIHEDGRLLLSGLGGEQDALFAAPTRTDYVAFTLLPHGGGGTTVPMRPDGLILAGASSKAALLVYGLVGDSVVEVDLVVDGATRRASMGENAFGVRIDGATQDQLDEVLLRRADGTTNTLDLGGRAEFE